MRWAAFYPPHAPTILPPITGPKAMVPTYHWWKLLRLWSRIRHEGAREVDQWRSMHKVVPEDLGSIPRSDGLQLHVIPSSSRWFNTSSLCEQLHSCERTPPTRPRTRTGEAVEKGQQQWNKYRTGYQRSRVIAMVNLCGSYTTWTILQLGCGKVWTVELRKLLNDVGRG